MIYLKEYNSYDNIKHICKRYGIKKYTINEDGSIDVNGDVTLDTANLKEIPLNFRNVSGDFNCKNNHLKSLKGCPKYIPGHFFCNTNELTSLEYGPEVVDGGYYCAGNFLTNLQYAPEKIGGSFDCSNNELTSFGSSLKKVRGYFDCGGNSDLYSIEGMPEIDDDFYGEGTPISKLINVFRGNLTNAISSMDYGYLRGNNIDKKRFKEALDEFGLKVPHQIKGYKYI